MKATSGTAFVAALLCAGWSHHVRSVFSCLNRPIRCCFQRSGMVIYDDVLLWSRGTTLTLTLIILFLIVA